MRSSSSTIAMQMNPFVDDKQLLANKFPLIEILQEKYSSERFSLDSFF